MYMLAYTHNANSKKTSASKSSAPLSVPSKSPPPAGRSAFSSRQLLDRFLDLLPCRQLWKLPALKNAKLYERLFTPIVTLWYLIFQRLAPDHTLERVLADAQAGGADSLCKRLSKKLLSIATTSYSNARQRLPVAFLTEALALQAGQILALNPKARWRGLLVSLLDGSTLRLRPYGDIPRNFPAHRNQAKIPAYWCLMRVVVCFCAHTGAALSCAWGATSWSEQVLACQILLSRAWSPCLFIGDRNFGIFRIVQTARSVGAQVLLRMSQPRARKLLGRSLCLGQHPVAWSPTRHDQLQPGCSKNPVNGQLLVVRVKRKGFRSQILYLFTTLPKSAEYPVEELVNLYGWRWHIELNLRYLKAQLDLVQLECKSAEMAQKEWLAGLMAYNLIRAAMLCAALQEGIGIFALSFSTSRRHLIIWLEQWGQSRQDCAEGWKKLLRLLGRARLPKRRKCRPTEPRAGRQIRDPYPPLVGSRRVARQALKKCAPKS